MDTARLVLELSQLLNVLLAAILGFAIGLERKMRFKEAGIRTHMIVSVGSALLMVVSKHAFSLDSDSARVAAQIVSGVGFLGAGIIMFRGQKTRGLTTAAGVWATAGVGMACGGELWIVAIGATAIMIGLQFLTHSNLRLFRTKKFFIIKIRFRQHEGAAQKIKEIFDVERFNNLVISRSGDEVYYSAVLNTSRELSSVQLDIIMSHNPYIDSIERCDDV